MEWNRSIRQNFDHNCLKPMRQPWVLFRVHLDLNRKLWSRRGVGTRLWVNSLFARLRYTWSRAWDFLPEGQLRCVQLALIIVVCFREISTSTEVQFMKFVNGTLPTLAMCSSWLCHTMRNSQWERTLSWLLSWSFPRSTLLMRSLKELNKWWMW